MSSPFIVSISGQASGTLRGKAAVRAYWQTALQQHPDLHFELVDVFVGVSSMVILYLQIGDATVMAFYGMSLGEPKFESFSLALSTADDAEARRLLDLLAQSGQVHVPLESSF